MSLNGLDDPTVKDAHEAAIAEPGGWFLLKYASRDEVEILGRGNGGIVEIRNRIAQYEESSPLYGFLRYRRRNVIIKYLPDDCSRLIQARVTVHFNSVCDRLSPYDTTFSITTSKELKDTKLSAACSLHTASGSTSSSTSSLRRRRLMEIAEEEEEERVKKRQSTVNEEERPSTPGAPEGTTPACAVSPGSPRPVTHNPELATSFGTPDIESIAEHPSFSGVARPSSPAKSLDDATRRMPPNPDRPDLFSYASYTYGRPKVKLGPRPSADVAGRPRTSGAADTDRPVSTMPTGLKVSKGSKKGRPREKSIDDADSLTIHEESADVPDIDLLASPSPDEQSLDLATGLTRPHTSGGGSLPPLNLSGSNKLNLPAVLTPKPKQHAMTPEKARLMKAMKLREMKKKTSQEASGEVATTEATSDLADLALSDESKEEGQAPEANCHGESAEVEEDEHAGSKLVMLNAHTSVATGAPDDHVSVETPADSDPACPVPLPSDIGGSAKASPMPEGVDGTEQLGQLDSGTSSEADNRPARKADDVPAVEKRINDAAHNATESTQTAPQPSVEMGKGSGVTVHDGDPKDAGDNAEAEPLAPEETPQLPDQTVPAATTEPSGRVADPDLLKDANACDPPAAEEPATAEREPNEEAADLPGFDIPTSKFSTREAKPSGSAPAGEVPATTSSTASSKDATMIQGRNEDAEAASNDTATIPVDAGRPKRKRPVEPIRTDIDQLEKEKSQAEGNLSDDEDLMEELQSATLQQAKPIMVSKSPLTPVFPNLSTKRGTADHDAGAATSPPVRAASNPIRGSLLTPADISSSTRAVSSSAAFLHKIGQQPASSDLRPKSAKIGSSISQRIKALEMRSASSVANEPVSRDRPSSAFFSVRKSSVRETSRPASIVDRAESIRHGTSPTSPQSRDSSPEALRLARVERSGSMANRLSMFEGGSMPRGRPDTIQVTARIIRDPGQNYPRAPKANATDFGPLELKQSPLFVNHHPGTELVRPSTMPAGSQADDDRRLSSEKRRSQSYDGMAEGAEVEPSNGLRYANRPRRRSSLTVVKDFIKDRRDSVLNGRTPSTDNLKSTAGGATGPQSRSPSRPPSAQQNSLFARRLSISSRRSSVDQKGPTLAGSGFSIASQLSPSLTSEANGELDGGELRRSMSGMSAGATSPNHGGKGGSRASRFMRRLSNSLGSSRKNTAPSITPTVTEEGDLDVAVQGGTESRDGAAAGQAQPSIAAYLGDVNVQFPDNLLWKRRAMCLDNQGFLILSAVQGVTAAGAGRDKPLQAGAIKRYHLSEFRPPYTPEMELEELPNSVVLDLIDGSGLQIACEDRAGQTNVLNALLSEHRKHGTFDV